MKEERSQCFPFFMDSSLLKVLVVGGGRIATRRIGKLAGFQFLITVLSPQVTPEIDQLRDQGRIFWMKGFWNSRVKLKDFQMVIAATDQKEVNCDIVERAREQGVYLVNQIDDPSGCSFYFPGIVQKKGMIIGVSSDGKNVQETKKVTEKVWALLEEDKDW